MRRLLAPLVALVVLVSGCSSGTGDDPATAAGFIEYPAAKRHDVPPVAGELFDGTRFDLASLRGKVVVLNFWGSWCAPCRAEAPDLEEVYTGTKAAGVEFVGINIHDDRDKGRTFAANRFTYPSVFDPAGRIALGFVDVPPTAIPSTLVIDRTGKIAAMTLLPLRAEDLRLVVDRVVAESPRG